MLRLWMKKLMILQVNESFEKKTRFRGISGSTLIELVIVLALIALCAGAVSFTGRFFSMQLVRAAADNFAERCVFYQQKAIMSGAPIELAIDVTSNCYRSEGVTFNFGSQVCLGVPKGVTGPPSKPTQQILAPVTFPKNSIIFYPDGTMQAGAIYFTNRARDCLYACTIPIGHNSCVRRYCWKNTWELIL